jgi:hypothetical protein
MNGQNLKMLGKLTPGACLIHTAEREVPIQSLAEVLVQIRYISRSGHPLAEGDDELYLVTADEKGQRMFYPLAENGAAEWLGRHIAKGAKCELVKEHIRKNEPEPKNA